MKIIDLKEDVRDMTLVIEYTNNTIAIYLSVDGQYTPNTSVKHTFRKDISVRPQTHAALVERLENYKVRATIELYDISIEIYNLSQLKKVFNAINAIIDEKCIDVDQAYEWWELSNET